MSEKELELFIWNNINNIDFLRSCGLKIPYGSYYRQFHVFDAGRCDLVCFSKQFINGIKNVNIHVIEVKKEKSKSDDVIQLFRYLSFFEQYSNDFLSYFEADSISISGQLICKNINSDAANTCWLLNKRIIFSSYTVKDDGKIIFFNTEMGKVFYKGEVHKRKISSAISRPFIEYEFGIFDDLHPISKEDTPF